MIQILLNISQLKYSLIIFNDVPELLLSKGWKHVAGRNNLCMTPSPFYVQNLLAEGVNATCYSA